MATKRIAALAGIALVLASCGVDGVDLADGVEPGFVEPMVMLEEPQIEVVAAAGAGHDVTDPSMDMSEEGSAGDSTVEFDRESGIIVSVEMFDFGYVLDRDTVPAGVPIMFRFVNGGQAEHEAMFGSFEQHVEFGKSVDHGGDSQGGADVAALTLGVDEMAETVLQFDRPGEIIIGCHLPGHWEAGMSASFTVSA